MKVQRTKKGNLIVQDKHSFNSAVIGMLLGDASLDRFVLKEGPKEKSKKGPFWNRTVLRFGHKKDSNEYLFWKINLIKSYIDIFSVYGTTKHMDDKVFYGNEAFLGHRKNFHYLYKDFYLGGSLSTNNRVSGAKKVVKSNILSRIDELSLAIWYMDDGSLCTYSRHGKTYRTLALHTDSFSYEECVSIQKMFYDKFSVEFHVNHNGMTDKALDYGYKLRTHKAESVFNFIELVYDIVCDVSCMRYKLP